MDLDPKRIEELQERYAGFESDSELERIIADLKSEPEEIEAAKRELEKRKAALQSEAGSRGDNNRNGTRGLRICLWIGTVLSPLILIGAYLIFYNAFSGGLLTNSRGLTCASVNLLLWVVPAVFSWKFYRSGNRKDARSMLMVAFGIAILPGMVFLLMTLLGVWLLLNL